MKKFTLAILLLGLVSCGNTGLTSGLSGQWQVKDSTQTITLKLQDVAGQVTGTADLNFEWYTTERHFTVAGQSDAQTATLKLLKVNGELGYDLQCEHSTDWKCVLEGTSGMDYPGPGIALSSGRAWMFTLQPAQ